MSRTTFPERRNGSRSLRFRQKADAAIEDASRGSWWGWFRINVFLEGVWFVLTLPWRILGWLGIR